MDRKHCTQSNYNASSVIEIVRALHLAFPQRRTTRRASRLVLRALIVLCLSITATGGEQNRVSATVQAQTTATCSSMTRWVVSTSTASGTRRRYQTSLLPDDTSYQRTWRLPLLSASTPGFSMSSWPTVLPPPVTKR